MRVHLAAHISQETPEHFLAPLREGLKDTKVILSEGSDFPSDGVDILVTKARIGTFESDLANCGDSLRIVYVPYAGPPAVFQQHIRDKYPKVRLINSHHNAAPTSEYALALLLAASKLLVKADGIFRRNDWSPRGLPPDPGVPGEAMPAITLYGRKVCIVGFGSIGKRVRIVPVRGSLLHVKKSLLIAPFRIAVQVTACCVSLGMQVVATRRTIASGAEFEDISVLGSNVRVYGSKHLHLALKDATAVVVCCPGTPETAGMIGTEELKLLRIPGILVNVGRGDVVDETALFEALKEGSSLTVHETESPATSTTKTSPRLFAAGIDTWYGLALCDIHSAILLKFLSFKHAALSRYNYPTSHKNRQSTPPGKLHDFASLPNVVLSPHRGYVHIVRLCQTLL